MGILDEINDSVRVVFRYNGEVIAERDWNYLPGVNDIVELTEKKGGREFKVEARRFHDRKDSFLSGLLIQTVTLDLVYLGETFQ